MESGLNYEDTTSLTPLQSKVSLKHGNIKERGQLTSLQRAKESQTQLGAKGHVQRNLKAGDMSFHCISSLRLKTEDISHFWRSRIESSSHGRSHWMEEEMLIIEGMEVGETRKSTLEILVEPEGAPLVHFQEPIC